MTHPELKYCGDNVGFFLSRDPDTVLSPDAALFRRRLNLTTPWYDFAPEIVVEVMSPANSPAEMAFKRRRYFEAGAEQFWLVDPDLRQIDFYHRDGRRVSVTGNETIEGEGIAAEMRVDLAQIFQER